MTETDVETDEDGFFASISLLLFAGVICDDSVDNDDDGGDAGDEGGLRGDNDCKATLFFQSGCGALDGVTLSDCDELDLSGKAPAVCLFQLAKKL